MVTWKGRCAEESLRARLIADMARIAGDHIELARTAPPPPQFSVLLNRMRGGDLPQDPDLRLWDGEVAGNILVCGDVVEREDDFTDALKNNDLKLEAVQSSGSRYPYVRLSRLRLRGIEFKFFDPRGLYPGEDRFNCVFMQSDEFPFLDGRLVQARGPEWCARITAAGLKGVEWYVECPALHLRYFLEDWTARLLSWMRYFYIHDLSWRHRSDDHGYNECWEQFDADSRTQDIDMMRENHLRKLRAELAAEAQDWQRNLGEMDG